MRHFIPNPTELQSNYSFESWKAPTQFCLRASEANKFSRGKPSLGSKTAEALVRTIETAIDIDAPPERVWSVLTGVQHYPEWNPFIADISGPLVAGCRIRVRFQPIAKISMSVRPWLLVTRAGRELRWKGFLFGSDLFDTEHYFILAPTPNGTRFVQGERFSGLLAPLLGVVLRSAGRRFEALNLALKRRAEDWPRQAPAPWPLSRSLPRKGGHRPTQLSPRPNARLPGR